MKPRCLQLLVLLLPPLAAARAQTEVLAPAAPAPIKDCCTVPGSRAAMLMAAAGDVSGALAPVSGPPGMVWIPGGEFSMGGVGAEARPDEFPVHTVKVDGFWMDETEVTNAQFRKFADATGYLTTAERKPEWEELAKTLPPGTPKPDDSVLVAGSMIFVPTPGPVRLDNVAQWWRWMPGANWRHPLGPGSALGPEQDSLPVVHVSWDDAVAYCRWAGRRLPTEAEWERACRGGVEGQRFIWGDEAPSDTVIKANLWQGGFPYEKKPADGYLLSAPVKSFPPNAYGLYDIIGNVWEWTADWYRPDTYEKDQARGTVTNPPGPADSYDPDEPHMPKRVNRGGSFLCNAQYCDSYRPSARMKTSPDTGQIHLGFRTVISEDAWTRQQAALPAPATP
jgi:sulfatase modifying factor 1